MPKAAELNALSFAPAIPDPLSFGKHHSLAASAIGAAAALLGGQASAATIVVNSTADNVTGSDGSCTLREALANANSDSDTTGGDCIAGAGADIISLAGLSGTITLGGTHLRATGDTQFQGPGAGTLAINGNNVSRIFYVRGAGLDVTISGLTLTGGRNANGGAIRFEQSGSLAIDNTTITGNVSTSKGGALFFRSNTGTFSITNSTVSGNTASSGGAGLFLYNLSAAVTISQSTISGNSGGSRGSGLFLYKVNAPLTITDSTISGNSNAGRGGGIFLYKSSAPGSVTIQRSTVSGNTSGQGGGLFLYKTNSAIQLENSTISGNAASAGRGGGIYLKGPFGGSHSLDVRSSTIASNTASGSGGNIDGGNSVNTIQLTNSIVAGGAAPSGPDIRSGAATVTANFSLVQNTSDATIGGASNQLGVDPQLAALANNGGSTQTRLIASSSPALNAGTAAGLPATDQRGFSRNLGAGPDMGAVELRTSPGAFSFAAPVGAINAGATVTSAGETIVGLDVGSAISIVGGSYSINGGPFVSAPGTVQAGDVITVRLTAPAVIGATASATVTIGGLASVFNVTTGGGITGIPTLSEWGMALLSSMLLLLGFKNRRTWFRKEVEKG